MSSFQDRETAFENKFAHDEHLRFRIEAKAVKLLGLWAAVELSLGGPEANAYAADLVSHHLDHPGLKDILTKIKADFEAKGITVSDHRIQGRLDDCLAEARAQLAAAP